MTNTDFSRSYLATAEKILAEAETLSREHVWHLAVRRCQEAVELFLKSLLRQAGIEIPHLHDVGALIRRYADRFPGLPVDRVVAISRRLREEREISFYGDDLTDSPPETLYDENDAQQALGDARFIRSFIRSFVDRKHR